MTPTPTMKSPEKKRVMSMPLLLLPLGRTVSTRMMFDATADVTVSVGQLRSTWHYQP
jgi:hypothetical protein